MAKAYTKEFLIDAFVSRYEPLGASTVANLRAMADAYYDEVGKDTFRIYASLSAEAIKEYRAKKS